MSAKPIDLKMEPGPGHSHHDHEFAHHNFFLNVFVGIILTVFCGLLIGLICVLKNCIENYIAARKAVRLAVQYMPDKYQTRQVATKTDSTLS